MLLDIAIIVFLMVAAILLILAEIFLLPGITLAGIGGAIFAIGGVVFAYTVGIWVGHLTLSFINHYIRNNLRLVIAFPVF